MQFRRPVALTAVPLVLALAACSPAPTASPSQTPASPPTSTTPSDGASPATSAGASGVPGASGAAAAGGEVWLPDWAADVPDAVANRRPLPFCGVEKAPAPQPAEFIDRAVRLCFWNAHLARAEAEYVSVQTTMEGAPFAAIYRLATDGTVEVLTDMTQDPLGGGWSRSTCAKVVEGEGGALVGVAECEDGGSLE